MLGSRSNFGVSSIGYSDFGALLAGLLRKFSNGGSSVCGIRIRAATLRALRRRSRAGFSPASPVDGAIIAQANSGFNGKDWEKQKTDCENKVFVV